MNRLSRWTFISLCLLGSSQALAGSCDARFDFNNSLADLSGNGYDVSMIDRGGYVVAMTPASEGKFAQGLPLNGTYAFRAPVDLHAETCPKVTVAFWVKFDAPEVQGYQYIFSTGNSGGQNIVRHASHIDAMGGGAKAIVQDIIRSDQWEFLVAIFDNENKTVTLRARNRSVERTMNESGLVEAMPDIWIGAKNDELQGITTPATIDNLWIFGRILTDVEIAQTKNGIWPDGEPQAPEQQREQDPEAAAEMARQQNELERLRREAEVASSCSSDNQCEPSNGFTGACYSLGGATASCYQRCDRDDDCNSGIRCISVTLPAGTLDGVCVPD